MLLLEERLLSCQNIVQRAVCAVCHRGLWVCAIHSTMLRVRTRPVAGKVIWFVLHCLCHSFIYYYYYYFVVV